MSPAMSAKEPTTSMIQRRRAMRKSVLLSCAACCCLGDVMAAKSHYLRHGNGRRRRRGQAVTTAPTEAPTAAIDVDSTLSQDNECPPSFNGYYPMPGCRKYYRCRQGSRSSSMEHECVEGLLFDESTGICNWADHVTCSILESADSQPVATTSKQDVLPDDKEVIGYWLDSLSSSVSVTPDQLDYTKLTRINCATFTTDASGKIYMTNPNSEVDLLTLVGPRIWYVHGDVSSKEYCLASPFSESLSCTQHDSKGLIHLAHASGVEVYASITLGAEVPLLGLNTTLLAENAINLMTGFEFDGLDIIAAMATDDDVAALQTLLSYLQARLLGLMDEHSRSYGLSLVVPCQSDSISYSQDIINLVNSVGELNLLTFDSNMSAESEVAAWQISVSSNETSDNVNYSVDACVNVWETRGISRHNINVGLAQEDEESIFEEVEYGFTKGLNGFFIWDLAGDVLGDHSTPILDVINSFREQSDIASTGTDLNGSNSDEGTTDNSDDDQSDIASTGTDLNGSNSDEGTTDKVDDENSEFIIVNGTTITGRFGSPRYYAVFGAMSCADDEISRPLWVSDDHLYKSKEQCCSDTFHWIDLETCLGHGFIETNFITEPPTLSPTSNPSMMPSISPSHAPSSPPSMTPSISPSHEPTLSPILHSKSPPSHEIQSVMSPSSNAVQVAPTRGSVVDTFFISIPADEDATLSEEEPETAPFHSSLNVDGGVGKSSHAFIKFDLSFMELGTSFTSVKLRLFVVDGSGFCGTFTVMDSTSWSETSITYANAPVDSYSLVIGQAWDVKSGEWFEMDVTGAAHWAWEESQSLSIHITSDVANHCIFSSSNGSPSHAPYLLVELEDQAESTQLVAASRPTGEESSLQSTDEVASRPTGEADDASLLSHPMSSPTSDATPSSTMQTNQAHSYDEKEMILRATSDATIIKEESDLNFGQDVSLVVDNDGIVTSDILIRFDIASVHKKATKAVLALYTEEECESAGVFTTTSCIDSECNEPDWNEDQVSWSIAPSYETEEYGSGTLIDGGGTMIGSFGGVDGAKWTGFDVISAFQNDSAIKQSTMTFRVSSDGGHHCKYVSIQGGKAAKLMLEF